MLILYKKKKRGGGGDYKIEMNSPITPLKR